MILKYETPQAKLILLYRVKNAKGKRKEIIKDAWSRLYSDSLIFTNYEEALDALPVSDFLKIVKIKEPKRKNK